MSRMNTKKKPIKIRHPLAPGTRKHCDRKKEAKRKGCRGKVKRTAVNIGLTT